MPIKPSNSPDPSLGLENDIVEEFGGTRPHLISEYYKGNGLVPAESSQNNSIPVQGNPISFSDFYGTASDNPGTITVTITSSASPGDTLTAVTVEDDPDGVDRVEYQWQTFSEQWNNIAGATSSSYVTPVEVEASYRVIATLFDVNENSVSATSNVSSVSLNTLFTLRDNVDGDTPFREGTTDSYSINVGSPEPAGETIDFEVTNIPAGFSLQNTTETTSYAAGGNQATFDLVSSTVDPEYNLQGQTITITVTGRTSGATATLTRGIGDANFAVNPLTADNTTIDEGDTVTITATGTNINVNDTWTWRAIQTGGDFLPVGNGTVTWSYNATNSRYEATIAVATQEDATEFNGGSINIALRKGSGSSITVIRSIGITVNNITPSPITQASYRAIIEQSSIVEGNDFTVGFFVDRVYDDPDSGVTGETVDWVISSSSEASPNPRFTTVTSGTVNANSLGETPVTVSTRASGFLDGSETMTITFTGRTSGVSVSDTVQVTDGVRTLNFDVLDSNNNPISTTGITEGDDIKLVGSGTNINKDNNWTFSVTSSGGNFVTGDIFPPGNTIFWSFNTTTNLYNMTTKTIAGQVDSSEGDGGSITVNVREGADQIIGLVVPVNNKADPDVNISVDDITATGNRNIGEARAGLRFNPSGTIDVITSTLNSTDSVAFNVATWVSVNSGFDPENYEVSIVNASTNLKGAEVRILSPSYPTYAQVIANDPYTLSSSRHIQAYIQSSGSLEEAVDGVLVFRIENTVTNSFDTVGFTFTVRALSGTTTGPSEETGNVALA